MHSVHIGTSGFNYRDWKGKFYPSDLPQRKWLEFYSQEFGTVEMNATFYGSFKKETYAKWASQTPKNFQFVIKGSRFITHVKRLKDVDEAVNRQLDGAEGLDGKLSIMLWQFPASFHATDENRDRLNKFLTLLPLSVRHAFEFRHESWFVRDVFESIGTYNGTVVLNETKAFAVTHEVNGSFVYLRFHGPEGLYSSSYSEKQLQEWAEKMLVWGKTRDMYAYFNNDVSGYAIENARTLRLLLAKKE